MLRPPHDGAFVELRTGGGGWTRAEFDRVLGRVPHVDVRDAAGRAAAADRRAGAGG